MHESAQQIKNSPERSRKNRPNSRCVEIPSRIQICHEPKRKREWNIKCKFSHSWCVMSTISLCISDLMLLIFCLFVVAFWNVQRFARRPTAHANTHTADLNRTNHYNPQIERPVVLANSPYFHLATKYQNPQRPESSSSEKKQSSFYIYNVVRKTGT